MKKLDLQYLCTVIGNLSGVPIRLYDGGTLKFSYSFVKLPKDPVELYRDDLWSIRESVGYFVTKIFNYYGIINSGSQKIIIGPTRQTGNTDQELRELAFQLDVAPEDTQDFVAGMKSIIRMPLESIMQILCTMNYVLNGEKLSLQDITVFDDQQDVLSKDAVAKQNAQQYSDENIPLQDVHNTFELEQTVMTIVRKGDTAALREWIKAAPAVRGGIIAADQLRQMKNTFIVSVTLTSRAAIRGGMDVEDAFSLSDAYIQKCELLNSPDQIMNLQYHMILEYTQKVERIRLGKRPGKLTIDVANYIQHHLSEPITAEEIAKELYLSRPYLSRKFIEETGESLTDFILKEKTEEAKRLLRYSDKSLTAISNYLGFSSQSHFSRVFKKYAACTPGEYREKYSIL
ncbi:MAG: helix-turn-helix domain-containing protein [Oscillospiraceae bacterium]|nr:helix-turn-helix domain-containing protein [Oscillospiraceae bacterium]